MSDGNRLDVYLHGSVAGALERRSQGRLRFAYDESWVDAGGPPLSLSLPVRPEAFGHEECAPFFEGLLPEGDFLKAIARTLHVSASNPFQLLTELGGECAGAISVAPSGGPEPGQDPRPPRWLTEEELAALLGELPQRPLIAAIDEVEDGGGFRLSLAGAQDKVGVLTEGEKIGLSHGKPPTTGILKPPIPRVDESVANEAFCMRLAAHADLDVAVSTPRLADSQEYLLVQRYDRSRGSSDGRLHQEDFCQALGLVPAVKYEREGGPTVADCAELIRRNCRAPARDLTAFLDALLFSFVIANHDAHAKNYSLLLDGPGSIRLAPLYDLISTAVYPGTDRKLAMRYGGENRPAYLRGRHLDRLARDLGVKPALVRRRAISMRERLEAAAEEARGSLPAEFQDRPVVDKVIRELGERCEALTKRATELSEPVEEMPVDDKVDLKIDGSAEAIAATLASINVDLEQVLDAIEEAEVGMQSTSEEDAAARLVQLAKEFEKHAPEVKRHGREIYDSVVEFGSRIEDALDEIQKEDRSDSAATELLDRLLGLAESAAGGLDAYKRAYSAISELEALPAVRFPVRNMRAGLRDLLDAQAIMLDWGRRAKILKADD